MKATINSHASWALAYALWDSRHSVRLEYPEDFDKYLVEAEEVRRWLKLHGFDLKETRKKPRPPKHQET